MDAHGNDGLHNAPVAASDSTHDESYAVLSTPHVPITKYCTVHDIRHDITSPAVESRELELLEPSANALYPKFGRTSITVISSFGAARAEDGALPDEGSDVTTSRRPVGFRYVNGG